MGSMGCWLQWLMVMLLGEVPEVYELLAVQPKLYMKVKNEVQRVASEHWSEELVESVSQQTQKCSFSHAPFTDR